MAAMHVYAYIFLTVTLLGGGFGVTDEEFKVSFISLKRIAIQLKCYFSKIRLLIQPYVVLFQDLTNAMRQMNEEMNVSLWSVWLFQ